MVRDSRKIALESKVYGELHRLRRRRRTRGRITIIII